MAVKGAKEAGENPLVPNAKLRNMYVAMLRARVLEEAVAVQMRGKGRMHKPASIRGQESVRVSTTIELGADDLVSDTEKSIGMGSILGTDPVSLLKSFSSHEAKNTYISRLLPVVEDAEQRLRMATGAALALKTQGRQGI